MLERTKRETRRVLIGVVGGVILLLGVIAIPYPGPGWAIVFIGLAILSTEFVWAKNLLRYAKGKYDAWQRWIKRQNIWLQAFFLGLTCFVVVATLWLLNAYGYTNDIFKLGLDWVRSPLPWFY